MVTAFGVHYLMVSIMPVEIVKNKKNIIVKLFDCVCLTNQKLHVTKHSNITTTNYVVLL